MICLHCFNDDGRDSCSINDHCPKCNKNGAWACDNTPMATLAKAKHNLELLAPYHRAVVMSKYCPECGYTNETCVCESYDGVP